MSYDRLYRAKVLDWVPPQGPLSFDLSPLQIIVEARRLIETSRRTRDHVAAIPSDQCSFESVIVPLAIDENVCTGKASALKFYQYVHPDKQVREASLEANKMMEQFEIESSMREDVYRAIQNASRNTNTSRLAAEDARLLQKMELACRRNGLALPLEQRNELKRTKLELSSLSIEFNKNMNEEKGKILFTKQELEGVPEDVLAGFQKQFVDGVEKLAVVFKTPDVVPVYRFAKREETRRTLEGAYMNRCPQNVPIIEKAIKMRRRVAQLLGYPTHADFRLEEKMAKNAKTAKEFLSDLRSKLAPMGEKELAILKELKRKEKEERGEPFDGQFYVWDYRYYDRLHIEQSCHINHEEIKEYFPLETVVSKIMQMYQKLLGLKFVDVPEKQIWHRDVTQYAVWDASARPGSQENFLGYLYFDLFPREGKYGHGACFDLYPGYATADGSRVYPSTAMVANLIRPQPGKPSLLTHAEVLVLFHELGHCFHQLCSRTRWARFHGTNVARDFVEAPSQMLENWCWNPDTLEALSSHYLRKGERLNRELVTALVASRNVNGGLSSLRQLFFGTFDMEVHTSNDEDLDTTQLFNAVREEVSLIKSGDVVTTGQAVFSHMMHGYDAGYYGYLWSEVFSADMYYAKFKENPLDPERGRDYRRTILERGGSKDELEMVTEFLGREPQHEAFLAKIGVGEMMQQG